MDQPCGASGSPNPGWLDVSGNISHQSLVKQTKVSECKETFRNLNWPNIDQVPDFLVWWNSYSLFCPFANDFDHWGPNLINGTVDIKHRAELPYGIPSYIFLQNFYWWSKTIMHCGNIEKAFPPRPSTTFSNGFIYRFEKNSTYRKFVPKAYFDLYYSSPFFRNVSLGNSNVSKLLHQFSVFHVCHDRTSWKNCRKTSLSTKENLD